MSNHNRPWTALLFLSPAAALLILFAYWPFLNAIRLALYRSDGLGTEEFTGLGNFQLILTDSLFWHTFGVLAVFAILLIPVSVIGPLIGARLVHGVRNARAASIYRFLFVLPVVVPMVVSVLIWRNLYAADGVINRLLETVGLETLTRAWLGDPSTVLPAIVFMAFPFVGGVNFLIYLAGFNNIPTSLYEAAELDGASLRHVFIKIELPMILPQVRIILMLAIIAVVHSYEHILVLTGGGPGNATLVPALYLFRHGFEWGNLGLASAVGCLLFLMAVGLSILNLKYVRTAE